MAPKKERAEKENVSLGPTAREGENVFGVCHIFASFNDSEHRHATAWWMQPANHLLCVCHQQFREPQPCQQLCINF